MKSGFILLSTCAVLSCVGTPGTQALPPEFRDKQAMLSVATLLEAGHLTEQRLDDTISARALDAYVETLDPAKYYFEQSDIDEFRVDRNNLDDMLRNGDTRFAQRVYKRYLERVDQRVAMIEKLLGQEHDFTVDEWFASDPEGVSFAPDADAMRERWRQRIKYNLLDLRADGMEDDKARERLQRRYSSFKRQMHRLEADEIVEMFVTALTTSFDPHSTYMGAHTLSRFEIQMRLGYQGIGALLVERDGEVLVERIFPKGPVGRHGGLKVGDQIIGVGQGDQEPLRDIVGMRLRDVVQLIRGKSDTVVRLSVIQKSDGTPTVHRLVRGHTELEEQAAVGRVFEQQSGDEVVKVGVLDLPSFYGDIRAKPGADTRSATSDVTRILDDFAKKGVGVVVLDLRQNGGGYLSEAVDVAGLFIDEGPVVQVKGFDGKVSPLADRHAGMAWKGPLVVLISKSSASASEIVAAAIKDYGRGLVVGDETSHGKGTVQRVMPLDPPGRKPELGALKLTIQKFYRVTGDSTQQRGVRADVALPSFRNSVDRGEAKLTNALPFDEIQPLKFGKEDRVKAGVVDELRTASLARRGTSKKFAEFERRVAAFGRIRGQTRIPLHEDKFRALRAELQPMNEEAAEAQRQDEVKGQSEGKGDEAEGKPPAEVRSAYFSEVLGIAADYVRLLDGAKVARDDSHAKSRKSSG